MSSIKIYEQHQPSLKVGTYNITVEQNFNVAGNSINIISPAIQFIIEAEKYAIDEQQIDSIFPPNGSMGDFSLMLPNIILNRSTLPWERTSTDNNTSIPWLALILLTEDEIGDIIKREDPKNPTFDVTKCYNMHITKQEFETNTLPTSPKEVLRQSNDELISVLVADVNFLKNTVLASTKEMQLLTHVRESDNEKAVVVSNRLPEIDKKNIVHLVSLENCFDATGTFKKTSGYTTIVSLKSWEFFCNDHFILTEEVIARTTFFGNTLQNSALKSKLSSIKNKEYFNDIDLINDILATGANATDVNSIKELICKTFRIGNLTEILKHLNHTPSSLRLPDSTQAKFKEPTKEYLNNSYVNLKYILKSGKETEAYYRGPLVALNSLNPAYNLINYKHADEALRYIVSANKLDVSYACAWEFGKLLAIQNKNFSTALYKWKRAFYQAKKQYIKELKINTDALFECPKAPNVIIDWFTNMKALNGIPFNYLVPDADFIPFESIRFFSIDENWIKHIIDGALSIGRISEIEINFDRELYEYCSFLNSNTNERSGFLLHSVAIAGWPNLVIYDDVDQVPFIKVRLSHNLLFCVFNRKISNINIHQLQESIHFGFEEINSKDELINGTTSINYTPSMSLDKAKRISLGNISMDAANFANSLIQKIEIITFDISK